MLPYIYFTGITEISQHFFLTTMDDRLYGVYKVDGMNLDGITDTDFEMLYANQLMQAISYIGEGFICCIEAPLTYVNKLNVLRKQIQQEENPIKRSLLEDDFILFEVLEEEKTKQMNNFLFFYGTEKEIVQKVDFLERKLKKMNPILLDRDALVHLVQYKNNPGSLAPAFEKI
jgi:hypothetical protein